MRFEPVLLALPALAAAQQNPLLDQAKAWYSQASAVVSSYLPAAPSSVATPGTPSIPNPIDAGASRIANLAVDSLTLENYKELLKPGAATASPGIEELLLYITGGNKTCFGTCGPADAAWDKAASILSASTNAPHLAQLSCETDTVLCNAWSVGPPSVYHMLLPQPLADQSTPASTVRYIPLNRTSVTYREIVALHTSKSYSSVTPYEGLWHPIDGQLAKTGLNIPIGYLLWGFNLVPSWIFMIGVSFLSRSFMGARRGAAPAQRQAAAPAPAR